MMLNAQCTTSCVYNDRDIILLVARCLMLYACISCVSVPYESKRLEAKLLLSFSTATLETQACVTKHMAAIRLEQKELGIA